MKWKQQTESKYRNTEQGIPTKKIKGETKRK